jgi:hypothetical protein
MDRTDFIVSRGDLRRGNLTVEPLAALQEGESY